MRILDLRPDDKKAIQQVATLLIEGFKSHWSNAWPDMETTLKEVQGSFETDRVSRVAVGEDGEVLGWIGGIRQYDGKVWELHPLVVHPTHRRKGIGRALVTNLERQVRERGGLTLWLGADDEDDMTTLAGVDLYPNVLDHLAKIKNCEFIPMSFTSGWGSSLSG